MWIKFKKNASGSKSVQLVESVRVLGKKHTYPRVVKIFGTAKNDEDLLRLSNLAQEYLKNLPKVQYEKSTEAALIIKDSADIESCTSINVGFKTIFSSLYKQIFSGIKLKNRSEQILRDLAIMRIAHPKSKRYTANEAKNYGLDLELHSIYKSMDRIDDTIIQQIQELAYKNTKSLLKLKNSASLDVLFYDLTTLSFETNCQDALREFGFSKDGKHQHVQIMLALLITKSGLPVGYELFRGNTYEGNTLIPALTKIKAKYQIDNLVIVADSGLISEYNTDQIKALGFNYIIGGRIKNSAAAIKQQVLDQGKYLSLNEDIRYQICDRYEVAQPYQYRILAINQNTAIAQDEEADITKTISKLKSAQVGLVLHSGTNNVITAITAILKNGATLDIPNDPANAEIYKIIQDAYTNQTKFSSEEKVLLSQNTLLADFIQTDRANNQDQLLIYYSQKRAEKDAYDRCKNLEKIKNTEHLAIKNKLSGCFKKSYVKLTNDTGLTIDQDKLKEAAQFDGYFSLQTNIKNPDAQSILDNYRGLWQIEQTFRISKYNLKLRPIFHYSLDRIKAHFAICYVALVIIRTLEYITKTENCYLPIEQLLSLLERVMVTSIDSKGNKYNILNDFPEALIPIYKCTKTKIPARFFSLAK